MWVTSGAPFTQAATASGTCARAGARPVHVIRGTLGALGLTWFRGRLYVASALGRATGIVARYSGFDGRAFAHRRVVIPSLGDPAPRARDDRARVPNGRLYLGVGAEQDALAGGHETSGTVVSFKGDGSDLRIEAKGLRGPFGLAFIPGTASLLVTDNGRDDLGVRRPPDELNLVRDVTHAAPDFGFPDCYDQGGRACATTAAPLALLPAHAGVGGVAVARGLGRAGLTAFVAENGSILPGIDAGRELRRIELRRRPGGGYDARGSVFATGFGEQDPLGDGDRPGRRALRHALGHRRGGPLLPGLQPLSPCDICRISLKPRAVRGDTRAA